MCIEIIDTTLRDGEQAPGIYFSNRVKWDIALSLMDIGIDEIEAGIPAMGKDPKNFITSLAKVSTSSLISAWSRFRLSDVKEVYKTGVDIIHISIPVSEYHLPNNIGSWKNIITQFPGIISYAKDHFKYVSIGLQDSFRSDDTRLKELCYLAEEYKLYRIRFSDTVGSSFPGSVYEFISKYRELFSGKIDFHGHNDFGLASANSLSALEAGADSVNVTINGIGERAGNTPLEQMAFIIDQHSDLKSNINLKGIKNLCVKLSKYTGRPLALDRPIVGDNTFIHESGIHCHGQLRNSLAYQPFEPKEKGLSETQLVVGTHSGRSNVIHILNSAGIDYTERDVMNFMHIFRSMAAKKKGYLTSNEVVEIFKKQLGDMV